MSDFCTVLKQIRGGSAAVELSEELRKVVAACGETLKPGTLTLTITISPAGNGKVWVTDKVGSNAPKGEKEKSLFFIDEYDNLGRTPPHQTSLGLGEVEV